MGSRSRAAPISSAESQPVSDCVTSVTGTVYPTPPGDGAPPSVGPDRRALLQERGHALAGAVELAGGGHDLDGDVVGVPLGTAELGVHRRLPPGLAGPRAAGGPRHEVGHGGVELVVGDHAVDQAPV